MQIYKDIIIVIFKWNFDIYENYSKLNAYLYLLTLLLKIKHAYICFYAYEIIANARYK